MFPNDGVIVDNAKALAAVPDAVGKTITSFSKISENFYLVTQLRFDHYHKECCLHHWLSIIASKTSGHAPATLSEANFIRSLLVLIVSHIYCFGK
jgi:hypothetical protein